MITTSDNDALRAAVEAHLAAWRRVEHRVSAASVIRESGVLEVVKP